MLATCLCNFDTLQTQLYSSLPTGHWRTNNQKSQQSLCGKQWWYPAEWLRNYFNHTDILRLQKSLATIVMDTELAQPVTPPPLLLSLPPFLMPPRLRVDSASLWQLLITGWPGPAVLCMTASRPAQVTQRGMERKVAWQDRERQRSRGRRREKERGDRKWYKGGKEGEQERETK